MWSYIWGMDFSIDKCNVLSITKNNLPFIFEYTILDKPLQRVQHMRDLGVLINTNLTWGTHCRGLINKCNRTMGMIKRAVGFNVHVNVTTSLYRTLVRSNSIVLVCGPPVRLQIQRLLSQYREQLLVIVLIIRKLNKTNDALCFICTHYLTDARLQICYMFLNVLKDTMTYTGIII